MIKSVFLPKDLFVPDLNQYMNDLPIGLLGGQYTHFWLVFAKGKYTAFSIIFVKGKYNPESIIYANEKFTHLIIALEIRSLPVAFTDIWLFPVILTWSFLENMSFSINCIFGEPSFSVICIFCRNLVKKYIAKNPKFSWIQVFCDLAYIIGHEDLNGAKLQIS